MSKYSSMLKKFGTCKEAARGTVESAPDQWIYVTLDSEIAYGPALLANPVVMGVKAKSASILGLLSAAGSVKFPLQVSSIGRFLHMLIPGTPVATELATVTITLNTNDKIDFTEDGGAEVTATLTPGTYAYGTASSQAGTLCALIKSCMEAAGGDPTYTVTYSYSTKKFTITKNSGVFVIKWATGTNTLIAADSVLGFTTADTSSAIAATSDSTTAQWAMSHVFTPSEASQPQSYSCFMDRGLGVKAYNLICASQIKFSRSPDQFINAEVSLVGKAETAGSIGSPSYTQSGILSFQHDTFKIAGSSNTTAVKAWECTLKNGLFAEKVCSQEQTITDLLALENGAEGSFTIYFEDETERAKFLIGTETSLEMDIQGAVIAGAQKYRLDLKFDAVEYQAFPYSAEDNMLAAKVIWKANYSTANSRVYLVTLQNIVSAF